VCLNTTLGNVPIDRADQHRLGRLSDTVFHTRHWTHPHGLSLKIFSNPSGCVNHRAQQSTTAANHHKKINLPQPTQTDIIEPKRTTP
jgi:hypothetical protein